MLSKNVDGLYNLLSTLLLYHLHQYHHLGYNFIIFVIFRWVMGVGGMCRMGGEERWSHLSVKNLTCGAPQPSDC